MTREELLKRIEKKNKDIEKINKRIDKWSKGLRPEDIAVCEPLGNCIYGTVPRGVSWTDFHGTKEYQVAITAYRQYVKNNENNIPRSDDWNKGPNIDELHNAYIDLGEARNTLKNYQTQLDKMDNFEKEEKIKPLWDFLTNWENKVYDWYMNNALHYFELKRDYKEAWEKSKEKYKYINRYGKEDYDENEFYRDYYIAIDSLTKNLITFKGEYKGTFPNEKYVITSYKVDEAKLKHILKEEKQRKYVDLVNRVTAFTGIITDASNLKIGNQKGELNGIVVGEKGKAYVETISAGGYNDKIVLDSGRHGQCFHYRVIVNPIK